MTLNGFNRLCVHGYIHMDTHRCIYVTIIIEEDEANNLRREDIERVEREGNYVNTIFIHEIFKKIIPELRRQKQEDLHESEAILTYIVNSRPVRPSESDPVSKTKQNQTKN